jgi:hypothetical protein
MEHELMSLVPASRPDVTDACGCTPHMPSADGMAAPADQSSASAPPATTVDADAPRRSLKLVVTLTPAEGGQYRAVLALGADGCDPVLRSMTLAGLTVALEQVPALLAEAETHWRLHPRNPTLAPAPPRRTDADRPRSKAATPPLRADEPVRDEQSAGRVEGDPPEPPATEPAGAPERPVRGQLTLFG